MKYAPRNVFEPPHCFLSRSVFRQPICWWKTEHFKGSSQVQYLDTVTCYYWALECCIQAFHNFSGQLLPLSQLVRKIVAGFKTWFCFVFIATLNTSLNLLIPFPRMEIIFGKFWNIRVCASLPKKKFQNNNGKCNNNDMLCVCQMTPSSQNTVRELERMRKHKATNTWFPLNVIMPTFEEKKNPPDWKTSELFHLLPLYTRTCDGAMIASGYIRALNLSPNTEIAQEKRTLLN